MTNMVTKKVKHSYKVQDNWQYKHRSVVLFHQDRCVGRFDTLTGEDCYGGRKLGEFVTNDITEVEAIRGVFNKPVRALYVERDSRGGPSRLIEDFGFQWITNLEINMSPEQYNLFLVNIKVMNCPRPE